MLHQRVDMSALQNPVLSPMGVSDFYNGKTVFITGGTGFMGKVLLEKLLRSCPGISKIYLLIRTKKGQDPQERLRQLLCSPLFDPLRKLRPADLSKVQPIMGDITQPELAISASDRTLLTRTVNVVFHSAATVKFDEKLKLSVTINVLGTQRLVELCKKMNHLECLVHVSTAYCNCDRIDVQEMVYPPPSIGPDQITSLMDVLDDDLVNSLTSKLIGNRPNTYTFTKALAESWLKENKGDLPVVIVRPSIVICTIKEPLPGWVDNWNGPTGVLAAAGKGVLHSMLCAPSKTADMIPVDMVINLMIVAAWRAGTTKSKELQVYNCCTGQAKPILWQAFIDLSVKYLRKHPLSELFWYPTGVTTSSKPYNTVRQCFVQWMPAYVMDSVTWMMGGKPILVRIQAKLKKSLESLEFFTQQEWKFDDRNMKALNAVLTDTDREEYNFDVAKIDWETCLENYILGMRRFLFKEEATSLLSARKNLRRMLCVHRLLQVASVICMWQFLMLRYAPLRRMWIKALQFLVHLARMLPFL